MIDCLLDVGDVLIGSIAPIVGTHPQPYSLSPKKDLLKQLLDLNLQVAKAIERGEKVTAPGVPPSYGNPADLITDDCIKP